MKTLTKKQAQFSGYGLIIFTMIIPILGYIANFQNEYWPTSLPQSWFEFFLDKDSVLDTFAGVGLVAVAGLVAGVVAGALAVAGIGALAGAGALAFADVGAFAFAGALSVTIYLWAFWLLYNFIETKYKTTQP